MDIEGHCLDISLLSFMESRQLLSSDYLISRETFAPQLHPMKDSTM